MPKYIGSSNSFIICDTKNGISRDRIANTDKISIIEDLIKCSICLEIVCKPYECEVCGSLFCEACINE